MKAKPPLKGTERRLVLHSEAAIDPDLTVVVHPGNTKYDLAFWLAQPLDQCSIEIVWVLGNHRTKATKHLLDRLKEFAFTGVAVKDFSKDGREFFINLGQNAKLQPMGVPTSDKLKNTKRILRRTFVYQ